MKKSGNEGLKKWKSKKRTKKTPQTTESSAAQFAAPIRIFDFGTNPNTLKM